MRDYRRAASQHGLPFYSSWFGLSRRVIDSIRLTATYVGAVALLNPGITNQIQASFRMPHRQSHLLTLLSFTACCVAVPLMAADLVRCTSADGQRSTLHRGDCPSPTDKRTPVTAQVGVSSTDTYQNGLAAYKAGRYADALKILEPISKSHPLAQVLIGDMHLQGKGVPRNEAAGFQWMLSAANLGNGQAMSLVAISYEDGLGVAPNPATALTWWRKAAGFGHTMAQTALALRLFADTHNAAAQTDAMKWLNQAAVGNDTDAQLSLDAAYYEGARAFSKDKAQALHWLRAAAAQGNAEAQAAVTAIEKETANNSSTSHGYRFRLRRR